jgi:serine/threonine protein kinase
MKIITRNVITALPLQTKEISGVLLCTCPEPERLQQLVTGQLDESQAPPLELHLAQCPHCLAVVEGLPATDTLEEDVRCWVRHDSQYLVDTAQVRQLIQQLRQLPGGAGWQLPPGFLGSAPEGASRLEKNEGLRKEKDDPPLPRTGRYRLIRLLGAGGMGSVYLGEDPQLRRQVAVKIPHFTIPPQAREAAQLRFQGEAQLAASIRHPNVCPIYDVGEDGSVPYVVMAYVEGCSLAEQLRHDGQPTSPREAVSLAIQMAEGLAAVHAAGVIHRDLKPANVLLDLQGRVLLSDFGLARWQEGERHLTPEGAILGTPPYLAPEQLSSTLGPVTPRCDLYSLGAILYLMLTGRLPFNATETCQLLYQMMHETPPTPRSLRPDLDPALEAIVLRALARRPEDRFQTAEELALTLKQWLLVQDPLASPTTPVLKDTPTRGVDFRPLRNVPSRWLALGGVLALLAGALVGLDRRATTTEPVVLGVNGGVDLNIWRKEKEKPKNINRIWLRQPDTLPLRRLDEIQIEVKLDRPLYLYVIWVDSSGKVFPYYPWNDPDWTRPPIEVPKKELFVPGEPQHQNPRSFALIKAQKKELWAGRDPLRFPLWRGPPGMQTVVVLMRETQLPFAVRIENNLKDLPPQKYSVNKSVAWFRDWSLIMDDPERPPYPPEIRGSWNTVVDFQHLLRERLNPFCDFSRTVTFSFRDE